MTFSERFKKIRTELNFNQKAFADLLKTTQQAISQYENGRNKPEFTILSKIITLCNVNAKWLFSGKGDIFINDNNTTACAADHFTISCYNAEAAAGHGSIIEDCEVIDKICLSKKFIKEHTSGSIKDLAFIKVAGDSMEPTLRDKDLILLDHSIKTIIAPGIYVFRRDGELYVKRLMKFKKTIINVMSDNKDFYPPYQIDLSDEDEQKSFQILARAIYHCRKLK